MRFFLSVGLVSIIVLISACSSTPQKPVSSPLPSTLPAKKPQRPAGPLPESAKPKYNLTGYPINTQQGYIDGCETAKRTNWAFKDLNRYDKDDQYRMGWDDGFAICKMKK